MKFSRFLEEKIIFLLANISLLFLLSIYLFFLQIPLIFILVLIILYLGIMFGYLVIEYQLTKKKYNEIIHLVDSLNEKYLITDIIKKPNRMSDRAYYYALKKACKDMNDKISDIEKKSREYQEYIESFAHEIKTPIASLALYSENKQDKQMKREVKRIDNLVEQVLYYARSETVERDYFIRQLDLEELIHHLLMEYRPTLLENKIQLNIHDVKRNIYCDWKWLDFIISQILQNSIKYRNPKIRPNIIEIFAKENKYQVELIIWDNGIGILPSDLPRVLEKGFTGGDRKKEYATGMGLYLCKKLCDKLNLQLEIASEYQNYTEVKIIFPKGDLAKLTSSLPESK